MNGDGFDDLIVGAPSARGRTETSGGESYVIFGQASGPISRTGTVGDDVLRGGEFSDSLDGLEGNDRISGNAGNDKLLGGAGRDRLLGEAGHDRLVGGLGIDILSGGVGRDTFLFGSTAESFQARTDQILDFEAGRDRIAISGIDADPDLAGNQAFTFLGREVFTGAGGEVRRAIVDGDTFVLADTDGDRQADLRILLDGVVALTADDFLL